MTCQEFLSIVQKGVREFPCEKAVRELREINQLSTSCGGDHYFSVSPEEKRDNERDRIRSVNTISAALSAASAGESSRDLFHRILNWMQNLPNANDRQLQLEELHRDLGLAGFKDLQARVVSDLGW